MLQDEVQVVYCANCRRKGSSHYADKLEAVIDLQNRGWRLTEYGWLCNVCASGNAFFHPRVNLDPNRRMIDIAVDMWRFREEERRKLYKEIWQEYLAMNNQGRISTEQLEEIKTAVRDVLGLWHRVLEWARGKDPIRYKVGMLAGLFEQAISQQAPELDSKEIKIVRHQFAGVLFAPSPHGVSWDELNYGVSPISGKTPMGALAVVLEPGYEDKVFTTSDPNLLYSLVQHTLKLYKASIPVMKSNRDPLLRAE